MSLESIFFLKDSLESESCGLIRFIEEPDDCQSLMDSFISVEHNPINGNILVESTVSRPNIPGDLEYEIVLDGDSTKYKPNQSILNTSIVTEKNIVSLESYESVLSIFVNSEDKSKGCKFNYNIGFDRSNFGWTKNSDNYSITYTSNHDKSILDLSDLTFEWMADGAVISGSSSTKLLSDNYLATITNNVDVVVSVRIVEIGINIEIGTIVIERNGYNVDSRITDVISGGKIYGNIYTSSTFVAGATVLNFINGSRYNLDYIDYEVNTDGVLSSVLTTNENMQTFNSDNFSEYLSYKNVNISSKFINDESESMVNNSSQNGFTSTSNANKVIPVIKIANRDYLSVSGYSPMVFDMRNLSSPIGMGESNVTIPGTISESNGDLYCVSNDGVRESVSISNLVNKEMITVDVETTSVIQDIDSMVIFFNHDQNNNFNHDDEGWMWSDDDVVSKDFDDKKVIQVEFELSFNKNIGQNMMSKLLFIAGSSTGRSYKYGFERSFNGDIFVTNEDLLVVKTIAKEYSMKLVIRLTILSEIDSVSFVFDKCSNDNMKIRNIIMTEEK